MRKEVLNKSLSKLTDIERERILAEIKSLRLQSSLSILTAIGAVLAFLILNGNQVVNLFRKKSTLVLESTENFIRKNTLIKITSVDGKTTYVKADFGDIEGGIPLPSNSYEASVLIDTSTIWKRNFHLKENQELKILLPEIFRNRIKVYTRKSIYKVRKAEEIDLEVFSTGNGFVWLYETDANDTKLLFPVELKDSSFNEIVAGVPFKLPNELALVAGDKIKLEKYIILVTSVNDERSAQRILNSITGKEIEKGDIDFLRKNWGMASLDVDVVK